jgi:hypothetical protein
MTNRRDHLLIPLVEDNATVHNKIFVTPFSHHLPDFYAKPDEISARNKIA